MASRFIRGPMIARRAGTSVKPATSAIISTDTPPIPKDLNAVRLKLMSALKPIMLVSAA